MESLVEARAALRRARRADGTLTGGEVLSPRERRLLEVWPQDRALHEKELIEDINRLFRERLDLRNNTTMSRKEKMAVYEGIENEFRNRYTELEMLQRTDHEGLKSRTQFQEFSRRHHDRWMLGVDPPRMNETEYTGPVLFAGDLPARPQMEAPAVIPSIPPLTPIAAPPPGPETSPDMDPETFGAYGDMDTTLPEDDGVDVDSFEKAVHSLLES